jgi:hypothetical protein
MITQFAAWLDKKPRIPQMVLENLTFLVYLQAVIEVSI